MTICAYIFISIDFWTVLFLEVDKKQEVYGERYQLKSNEYTV